MNNPNKIYQGPMASGYGPVNTEVPFTNYRIPVRQATITNNNLYMFENNTSPMTTGARVRQATITNNTSPMTTGARVRQATITNNNLYMFENNTSPRTTGPIGGRRRRHTKRRRTQKKSRKSNRRNRK